jgi:hypothetical protein
MEELEKNNVLCITSQTRLQTFIMVWIGYHATDISSCRPTKMTIDTLNLEMWKWTKTIKYRITTIDLNQNIVSINSVNKAIYFIVSVNIVLFWYMWARKRAMTATGTTGLHNHRGTLLFEWPLCNSSTMWVTESWHLSTNINATTTMRSKGGQCPLPPSPHPSRPVTPMMCQRLIHK